MSEEDQDINNQGVDQGESSSDLNNDVTPDTHFKDEQGVPYYNRFRETSEKLDKFKDVDLDLYNRAKEYDLDEVEQALQFRNSIYSDQTKLAKVMQILKGQSEGNPEAGKNKGQEGSELQELKSQLAQVTQFIQNQNQNNWMKEYDSTLERSLSETLKNESFKDLGGKLTDFEKKAVMKLVDDTFQADAQRGKLAKLSIKDVPNVVEGVLKMVVDNRKGVLGGMVRKDDSPQPMSGSGKTGQPKAKPMTEEQRLEAMNSYMKDAEAGKSPVI